MKFCESRVDHPKRCYTNLQHELVIGPMRDSSIFPEKARLYYCIRCRWSFLVCGHKVAVLDEDGKPIAGDESFSRFSTFEEGSCPVLEEFASEVLAQGDSARLSIRREDDECSNLAPGIIRFGSARTRPLFRVFSRLREDLGRRP